MTAINELTFHEMTNDEWLAFSGAQCWGGDKPLVSEGHLEDGTVYFLVLDPSGACLILDDEQAENGGYQLCHDFASQTDARAFIYANIQRLTKAAFYNAGFEEV